MEFIGHKEFFDALKPSGVRVETEHPGPARCVLTPGEPAGLSPSVVIFGESENHPGDPPGARRVAAETGALPALISAILRKEHLREVALCPAMVWAPIVDLVAFDLAQDERWSDIDAEAALHLRTRDPLLLDAADLRLCETIAGAVFEHGEPDTHDFAVVAIGAPLTLNVLQRGRLVVWCGNPALADVIGALGGG